MFNYSSSSTVIPSLVFTKAELVYAVSVLMANIPPTDNETRIEMVELRHYLTLIKDKVSKASQDGTLERAMAAFSQNIDDISESSKAAPMPSMDELRQRFPSLNDEEIREVIDRAKEERNKEEEKRWANTATNKIPPPPSFIAKPIEAKQPTMPQPSLTKKQIADKENSIKFAHMLGNN